MMWVCLLFGLAVFAGLVCVTSDLPAPGGARPDHRSKRATVPHYEPPKDTARLMDAPRHHTDRVGSRRRPTRCAEYGGCAVLAPR